ncbi:MAG: peptide chain release factor N(5)-glutamine methyltransferase [Ferruginibacter sp.]|nr:peptide chain release factor N(5)-glutamine methyltransferase [Ferruginibacter sp.]
MTIKEIQQQYLAELEKIYSAGEAAVMTTMIFESIAKISTQDLLLRPNVEIENNTEINLITALNKLQQHEPIQYIIGKGWFYNVAFTVNEAVLIPRPETEELVLEAINFLKHHKSKNVLDIGTGSGCIPISIKKNITNANVTSLDVSNDALKLAAKNASDNAVEINFLHFDFLEEKNYSTLPKFDVIISNPPYIPENEKNKLDKNVTMFEPHIALFVPQNDPLLFYKKILIFAGNHLQKDGKIFLEIHEDFASETANLFTEKNYHVVIKKDMQDKERMLIINQYL